MIKHKEIETWKDLLEALQMASKEQLQQPVQICEGHPVYEHVHELIAGICIGTVDELEIKYARSVTDNRRHGEELVIFTDGNPFGEDGAIMYEMDLEGEDGLFGKSIYPKGYDDSQNWTGPAQKLVDEEFEKRETRGKGTLGCVLNKRLGNIKEEQ